MQSGHERTRQAATPCPPDSACTGAGTVKQVYRQLATLLMLPPGNPEDLLLLAEVGMGNIGALYDDGSVPVADIRYTDTGPAAW